MKRLTPIFTVIAFGCLDAYQPLLTQEDIKVIAVDGFINATDGSATVMLTRPLPVDDGSPKVAESGARVSIKTVSGNETLLTEESPGHYAVRPFPISFDEQYILSITTASGREFESDKVKVQRTPAIDSISYRTTPGDAGLAIMVNTHGDADGARRYVWNFSETYEYTSRYYSEFKIVNSRPVRRHPDEQIYRCWRTATSTAIMIDHTLALTDNILNGYVLTEIPRQSRKVSVRYSINVQQRAIDEQEYLFLQNLKKTTEDLGDIFDAVPFPVMGNLHETNGLPNSIVGYFSGGQVVNKRIFIGFDDLPLGVRAGIIQPKCSEELTCDTRISGGSIPTFCSNVADLATTTVVTTAMIDERGTEWAYYFTNAECGDCRFNGGTTTRPDFW